MANGTGRDWYILANHGGFIDRYQDTGDLDGIYARRLRTHKPIILKE